MQDFLDKDGNVICFLNDYMDENGLFTKKYPLPQTVEEYLRNIEIQKEIVNKRNKRIKDFVCSDAPGFFLPAEFQHIIFANTKRKEEKIWVKIVTYQMRIS